MSEQTQRYPYLDTELWLRSSDTELIEPIEAHVTGEVPRWVAGAVVRNGPGAASVDGAVHYNHLFDGPAMLHRYGVRGGRVTYQCRWVRSRMLQQSRAARRVVYTEFGTRAVPDPCHSIFRRMALAFDSEMVSDNASIAVYPMGDQLYAISEHSVIHRIDTENLDTLDRIDLQKMKIALIHHSAHPIIMPNGDVYNIGLTVNDGGPKHAIVKFPAKSKDMFESATVVATLRPRWPLHPCYMHSFGVTENYWVIIEQPFTLSMTRALWSKFYSGDPINNWFKWYPNEETHITLVSRATGRAAARYRSAALFYMHTVNAFERDGRVTLELCAFRDAGLLSALYLSTLQNAQSNAEFAEWFRSRPVRFSLPLPAAGAAHGPAHGPAPLRVEPELIVDFGMEMPRFNDTMFTGKPYKYFYALSTDVDNAKHGSLVKVNRETGQCWFWSEPDCWPSEPVFVPRPGATEEDDGVVMCALIWSRRPTAGALLVLDASNLRECARAELQLPGTHVRTFHGCFRPDPAPPADLADPADPAAPAGPADPVPASA